MRARRLAVVAAWLAFIIGLAIQGTVNGLTSFGLAGAIGAAIVLLGFETASRCRSLPQRSSKHRVTFAFLAVAVGGSVGVVNLAANWAIAEADPALRTLLVERFMTMPPWQALVAAPMTEEVVFRLFVMSVMAWAMHRVTRRPGLVVALALVGSAAIFALAHLARPLPADRMLANYYRAALMTKYTLLGVPMAWVFWRWGLPYAMVCHCAVNATHMALQWSVL